MQERHLVVNTVNCSAVVGFTQPVERMELLQLSLEQAAQTV